MVTILVALALILTAKAKAYYQDPALNRVASIFAERPVHANCYDGTEDGSPALEGAWGYVAPPLATQTLIHLEDELCAGAVSINDPTQPKWLRALGVLVVVHESYHLRRWGAANSESKVECKAIRHWKVAARMFGATPETVAELWPYALAEHYELANLNPWGDDWRPYFDSRCKVPPVNG